MTGRYEHDTPDDIQQEVEMFKQHLLQKTTKAESTAKEYGKKVAKLGEPIDFENMEYEEIINPLNYKISRGEGRAAVKSYFNYLRRAKGYPVEVRQKIALITLELDEWDLRTSSNLNKPDIKRKYLEVEEIQNFQRQVERKTKPEGFRASRRKSDEFRVIPLFLFETACRIKEALTIRVENIDWGENKIHLSHTKRGKVRDVNIDQSASKLEKLIDRYDIESGQLFEISRESDYKLLNSRLKRTGDQLFGKNVTAHWFRHSFATNMAIKLLAEGYSKGEAKEEIRDYLGHGSVDTTEKYIGAAQELDRENIYDKYGGFDALGV